MIKTYFNKLSTFILYLSILIFIIGFNFAHNPPSGWYQQFLPDLNNNPISDIIFIDSLNGFGVTDNNFSNDTGYIIKTTNGGDNWNIVFTDNRDYKAIAFIDLNIGYVCGAKPSSGSRLLKTTNSGLNWFNVNPPDPFLVLDDMSILNEDTIWLAASSGFDGGVFRTTNGGTNWTRQFSPGNNPNHIYMFNRNIGFIAADGGYLRKTTNSGLNWFLINDASGFSDLYFIDSLIGWKANLDIQKTTDGGLNWLNQILPQSKQFLASQMVKFSVLNKDTIWGVGGILITPNGFRGVVYKTTNGGSSWGYQLPDININVFSYDHCKFVNGLSGWAYATTKGVHTITGGDTTIYTSVSQISTEIPDLYKLFQNYPNPFNPESKIKYFIAKNSKVKIKIFDEIGRELKTLVNENRNRGVYEVIFDGSDLSTGVYFYRFEVEDNKSGKIFSETKRMLLLK